MADPFGTGAGIVGILSLAIQVTQAVVQFGIDWKHAPDLIKTFMAELGTLQTVLLETHTNVILNPHFEAAFQDRTSLLLSQLGPNAPATTDTKRMLEICHKKLDTLLKDLGKWQGHRLGWERFKGALLAKDIRDSINDLSRQCQNLNNILSIDAVIQGATIYKEVKETRKEQQEWHQAEEKTSVAIQSLMEQANLWQQSQDCQAILDWLTPIDYGDQQSDFINRQQPETGQWILDSVEFQTWLNFDKQTLLCPGIPGAGKTILTSIVIKKLTSIYDQVKSIGIAYIYCNYQRQHEQAIDDLLASLLKQLAQCQPSLPAAVRDLYSQHKTKRTRPSTKELSSTLQTMADASKFSRLYIIVDALDECQASNGCRQQFLSELFSLQIKVRANIFATSRFIPEITGKFSSCMSLEIRASKEDIKRYLNSHISQLPAFVVQNNDLQEEIITGIVNAADGMYVNSLYTYKVALILQVLTCTTSP